MTDSDSFGVTVLLVGFAVLLVVTCAAVGWRLAGHGPPLPLSPDPVTVQTVCCAIPFEETP